MAGAEGLIRDGELREAFDRLRWVLEVDPTHAAAQSLLEQARNAVAAPHGSLSGEAVLLEVSRISADGFESGDLAAWSSNAAWRPRHRIQAPSRGGVTGIVQVSRRAPSRTSARGRRGAQ